MRRFYGPLLVAALASLAAGSLGRASGAVRCVGGPHCYATIQAAVDAAQDGDTIAIGRGAFAGGVTVTKSVTLRGAGSGATTIRGGGPVLTIGTFGAPAEPTVTIDGVTITGGVSTSSPESVPFVGKANVFAAGGGIEVPPADGFRPGATVTITNSAIVGNRAAPTDTVPFGPPCPTGPCPYAGATGGGIDTWGAMTISNSVLSGNAVAGIASDAVGGAVASHLAALVLTNDRVTGNTATVVAPNGRFAEGGGLFVQGGTLEVRGSVFDRNSASLTSYLPALVDGKPIDMNANSGAIHVGDYVPTTIDATTITHNTVSVNNPTGEAVAFDSAVLINHSPLTMTNTVIAGNSASGVVATSADVGPGGSALEADGGGTISNTRIVDNQSSEQATAGAAAENGAIAVLNFTGDAQLLTIDHSVISGNTAVASSTTGSATAQGGGIFNNALLSLQYDVVANNGAKASGQSGAAQGGGIWNGVQLSGPSVQLTLDHTSVTGNRADGTGKIDRKGGGLYTTTPVTLQASQIAGNAPDQCFGC
jgi:hypothetical protein